MMKSKTKAPDQDPHKQEQNAKTNIGYENTPKKAKDTKGEGVASNDLEEQEKHPKHWNKQG